MSQRAERLLQPLDLADEVRDFYDRYAYPPPADDLGKYQQHWQDQERRRADYLLFWPAKPYKEDQSILVAGCGTSQAAKHALRWPAAQVTGIDFSATSVQRTEELKRKYNLQNLRVYQLALEQVNELGMSFDQIVCTGVLHHLADPDAGLRALRSVLKPEGAMHLMVYAPYGRIGIYMLQEFCRRVGVHATDADIRDLITAIGALPPEHPLRSLLKQAADFRNEAALADALLHPQDRAYSVSQLFDFIEKAGLTFGRWIRQAPYSIQCGVVARLPQAAKLACLPLAAQYASIELFRGTMVRHSAVVYRSDNPGSSQTVTFAGDAWLHYVPLRLSGTVCIQDQLPAGAAAVLINQAHTYKDIFLPIGPMEKRLFDAIDGIRSIGELAESTLPLSRVATNINTVRIFFERLWCHDQVVYDLSRGRRQADDNGE